MDQEERNESNRNYDDEAVDKADKKVAQHLRIGQPLIQQLGNSSQHITAVHRGMDSPGQHEAASEWATYDARSFAKVVANLKDRIALSHLIEQRPQMPNETAQRRSIVEVHANDSWGRVLHFLPIDHVEGSCNQHGLPR